MPRYRFPALTNRDLTPAPKMARTVVRTTAPTDRFITPLEKSFPHILEKIQVLWGYPELNLYFSRLTIDDRGDRDGFPTDVWDDLQMLMLLHQDFFPDQRS